MLITRTPLRVSLVGGGSDFPYYYNNYGVGKVLSFTISKYLYVTINRRYDKKIHVGYSSVERVDTVEEIRHDIVRNVLAVIDSDICGVEIHTISDIPSGGSGLGSSSAITIGLIRAVSTYLGMSLSTDYIADMACDIEINMMGKHIGKQDQYACAFTGFNEITFTDDKITVVPVLHELSSELGILSDRMLIFYTGDTRRTDSIINTYSSEEAIDINRGTIELMVGQVDTVKRAISLHSYDDIGYMLDEAWQMKKSLSPHITNEYIDSIYKRGISSGALGGKLLGAGGCGHVLFYCPTDDSANAVRASLSDLIEIEYNIVQLNNNSNVIQFR